MPKEETIELRHVRNTIGEIEDLPSLNPRVSLASRLRAITTKLFSIPQLIHLYGALGLNKTLTFSSTGTIYSVFSDGAYLYCFLTTDPGKVIKVDLNTFTEVSTLTFDTGEQTPTCSFSDGTYLYAGLSTNPGKVVKINLSSFTEEDVLTLDSGEKTIKSLYSDGTYLYAGLETTPGKIVKIDLSTFTKDSTLDLSDDSIQTLFSDGLNLYAGLWTSPGKIIKVNINTFTETSALTLSSGENIVTSLFSDGMYLYAGLRTNPAKISKIDLTSFTKVNTLSLTGENIVNCIFMDGTYLYAGVTAAPSSSLCAVDLSTFAYIAKTSLETSGTANAIFSDGTHIYAALSGGQSYLQRTYIIPSADSYQRKIDLTDVSVRSTISATTSDGNVGGTTLIDTARTEGDDYWNNLTLLILGGDYKGQARKITDFDAASDTITVSPAFGGKIVSGVRYAILPYGSSSLLITDILADSTPFNGADIPIIKADTQTIEDSTLKASPTAGSLATFIASGGTALGTPLPNSKSLYDVIVLDRLSGTETISSYNLPNDTAENTLVELVISTRQRLNSVWLDFVNLVQNVTIKVYHKIDGTNYRQYDTYIWTTSDEDGVFIKDITINGDWKLTITSAVAQGGIKAIPYNIITTPME